MFAKGKPSPPKKLLIVGHYPKGGREGTIRIKKKFGFFFGAFLILQGVASNA